MLRNVNWLGDAPLEAIGPAGMEIYARVRSTRPPQRAEIIHKDGETLISLLDGETGVAPGQACVFYAGEGEGARVLGGGWIARAERNAEAELALRRLIVPEAVAAA